jgi:hypothetical protein
MRRPLRVHLSCCRLADLALGGGSALLWREDASLPAFSAVTQLRLARRNHLQVSRHTSTQPAD